MRGTFLWAAVIVALTVPLALAAKSPQLAWRDSIYIAAGFAGVLGMALLVVQPLLAAGDLPGLTQTRSRLFHRLSGMLLVLCILIHVGALWITSPPDVIDALLFASPTPFSAWGVIAMWAAFAAAALALWRRQLRVRPVIWRRAHVALAVIVALGTVTHALLIEGTMEWISKLALSAFVALAALRIAMRPGLWRRAPRPS